MLQKCFTEQHAYIYYSYLTKSGYQPYSCIGSWYQYPGLTKQGELELRGTSYYKFIIIYNIIYIKKCIIILY